MKKNRQSSSYSGGRRREGGARPVRHEYSEKLTGVLQGNRKGFGFLICEDREHSDIFIGERGLNGALHGDVIEVGVLRGGTKPEGEVIRIISRGINSLVGSLLLYGEDYGYVMPDDERYARDVYVAGESLKLATNNDKVLVRILGFEKGEPYGEIAESLGADGRDTDILSIIRSYDLYESFPKEVLSCADKVCANPPTAEGREDIRELLTFTIDGEDAKDLDDAVSLTKRGDIYELGVHIADVSSYVGEADPLDVEAFKRGTSVYFPGKVYPMLPKKLSNGVCSLGEGEDRLTLSAFMQFDASGNRLSSRVAETVIRSRHRLNYTEVSALLGGDEEIAKKYSDIADTLRDMERLQGILLKKRKSRGALDLDIPEFKVILGEDGEIEEIVPYERGISNRMIEEFMLAANEAVAEKFAEVELPFIYRVHERPAPEKVTDFVAYAAGLGFSLKCDIEAVQPSDYVNLLSQVDDSRVLQVVNSVMLRTMMKARYSSTNSGHFGLASECYCHFTSPIRRYPDLFIHRMIKKYLRGEGISGYAKSEAERAALQSSEREKTADEAERAVDDYYRAEYMRKHLGEEFTGIISGVKEFGVFVKLPSTIEGLVRIEDFPSGYYEYDEKKFCLTGPDRVFRLGDEVEIMAVSCDPKINFTFTEREIAKKGGKRRPPKTDGYEGGKAKRTSASGEQKKSGGNLDRAGAGKAMGAKNKKPTAGGVKSDAANVKRTKPIAVEKGKPKRAKSKGNGKD